MRGLVALCCLIGALGLLLTGEIVAPDDNASANEAVVPAGPSPTLRSGTGKSAQREFGAEALGEIAAAITDRPLFSPTRRPSDGSGNPAGSATALHEVPRLTGVIVGPAGGWAIFADANGKSHAAAAGDAIGGFTVRAIGPGVVTLTGSEGDRVLHPTYANPPAAASSEIPGPDATSPLAIRGNRNREGVR